MADTEADLQKYLADHKVESLLKDMVVKICLAKPEDPLQFVKQYVENLQQQQPPLQQVSTTVTNGDNEPEEADDVITAAPVGRKASRRGAVSASVMGTSEALDYEKKIVPKDAATMMRLQSTIRGNLLFQHLEKDEMMDVLDAMFLVKCAAGDVIIKQGDDGDNFYCIDSGTVEVWISQNGGEPEKASEITDGGFFGELALIYGTPRAATIKAKTACDLWAIDRDTYRRILMQNTIRKRKMYESFLEKVKLLDSLDKWERLAVADVLEPVDFAAGSVIVKQGDPGNEFFILVEGKASVMQTNNSGETGQVAELGPADYFGEIALLTHDTRKATVTAVTDVKCAKLDRERFERVLGPCEAILRRNMENYKQFRPEPELVQV